MVRQESDTIGEDRVQFGDGKGRTITVGRFHDDVLCHRGTTQSLTSCDARLRKDFDQRHALEYRVDTIMGFGADCLARQFGELVL